MALLTWDFDPVFLQLGPLTIRYYGLIFALTLLGGFWLWRRQALRGGYSERFAEGFLLWGAVATVVGARLGHCFFYRAGYFLTHPLEIFAVWEGGLASHGATVGLVIALAAYALRWRVPVLEVMDRFVFSAALASASIRLANFLNSEIVGRPTDVPWAVRFVRFEKEAVPRHPSQLYEFAMGLCVLAGLVLADRLAGRERRKVGMLTGLFLIAYFSGRFCVEFFKEYHTLHDSTLTMGQYLSIPAVAAGIAVLARSLLRGRRSCELPRPEAVRAGEKKTPAGRKTGGRKVGRSR